MNPEEERDETRDAADETIGVPSEPEEPQPEEEAQEEPGGRRNAFRAVLARLKSPRVLLLAGSVFVFIVLLGGLGLWLLSPSGESASSRKEAESKPPLPVKTEPPSERMVKHDLAPFYIPLPRGSKGWMARVTLAVTWDGSSLKRFEDQQILARDRLYRRMTELAAGEESMRGISLTVRSEAQRILEELLRPGELHVVVTGIFIV